MKFGYTFRNLGRLSSSLPTSGGAKIFRKDSIERIEPPKWEIEGISAGARDLVLALDENREVASPAKEALHVVEIIHGFLKSQQRGNTKIRLPLTRA